MKELNWTLESLEFSWNLGEFWNPKKYGTILTSDFLSGVIEQLKFTRITKKKFPSSASRCFS
jgi:hypothetical protein